MAPRKPVDPAAGAADAEPGFEEALERLETIVEELEAGALTLEQSIARYEEGMRLSRRLTRTLEEAEQRIERLVAAEGAEPATQPMDLDAANDEPEDPGGGAAARRVAAPRRRQASGGSGGAGGGGMEELPF
jgi:exodeoxyribonuclease VII small subunit